MTIDFELIDHSLSFTQIALKIIAGGFHAGRI